MSELKALYFPHEFNSRSDDKILLMREAHGAEGYGIYWMIVEKLYQDQGRISRNYKLLGWDLRVSPKLIESIVEKFNLFFIREGKIGSVAVDRRIAERHGKYEIAKKKGIASGMARREKAERRSHRLNHGSTVVQQRFNSGSTEAELTPNKERKKESL